MWIIYKFNANDVVEHIERNIHDCNILTTFSPNIFRMIYEFRVWPPTITINYYQLVTSLSRNYDAQLMLLIWPFWCFILNESHPIKYWCATVLLENEQAFILNFFCRFHFFYPKNRWNLNWLKNGWNWILFPPIHFWVSKDSTHSFVKQFLRVNLIDPKWHFPHPISTFRTNAKLNRNQTTHDEFVTYQISSICM